jgi:hypothetical protein
LGAKTTLLSKKLGWQNERDSKVMKKISLVDFYLSFFFFINRRCWDIALNLKEKAIKCLLKWEEQSRNPWRISSSDLGRMWRILLTDEGQYHFKEGRKWIIREKPIADILVGRWKHSSLKTQVFSL